MRECVYQYLSSLCIEANYYQSLQLKPDYARLNIALFVCSSGQEFPHVLTRTEPRVGCMRNTSVVHRASLSLCPQRAAIVQQRARGKPGTTRPRQEQPGESRYFMCFILKTSKTAIKKINQLSFDFVTYVGLCVCVCTCGYPCL